MTTERGSANVQAMHEPAPPLFLPLFALASVGIGVYVLFMALALEWYPLLAVAGLCFVAAFAPALKLVKRRR